MVRTGATFADARGGVSAIRRARPRAQAVDRSRLSLLSFTPTCCPRFGELPVEDLSAAVIEGWLAGYEGSTRSRSKLLIQLHGILERARKVLRTVRQRGDRRREVPPARERRHPGLLTGGSVGARPRCGVRAGRGDLPHRGLLPGSGWGSCSRSAALARRRLRLRLRRQRGARASELLPRPANPPPSRAKSARSHWRRRLLLPWHRCRSVRTGPGTTSWFSSVLPAAAWTDRRCAVATRPRWSPPVCAAACDSTHLRHNLRIASALTS